jgi:hypothetical protein
MATRGRKIGGLTSDGSDYQHRQKVESHYEVAGKAKANIGALEPFAIGHLFVGVGLWVFRNPQSTLAVAIAPLLVGIVICASAFLAKTKKLRELRDNLLAAAIAGGFGGVAVALLGIAAIAGSDTTVVLGMKEWNYIVAIDLVTCVAVQAYALYWAIQLKNAWKKTDRKKSK